MLMCPIQVQLLQVFSVLPNGTFKIKFKSNGDKASPFIQVILNWERIRQLWAYPDFRAGYSSARLNQPREFHVKIIVLSCKQTALLIDIDNDIDIFLTAVLLTPGGSSTVHIYTKTIHKKKQLILKECWTCPVFASYTLQLRKKHGKTSVRVAEECQLARWKQNIQNRTYMKIRIHKHNNKNT